MLLQANDFRHLAQHHDVELQLGGSDQWGNITVGIDLIRKSLGRSAHGITWPLLLKKDGTKFGKTADGAVWLDPAKTSPYQFRQFWFQADDAEVERYLLQFTLRPVTEIAEVMEAHRSSPERRLAQRTLARDLTALVHGPEAADAADEAADVLFYGDPASASAAALEVVRAEVPCSRVTPADLGDPVALLVQTGLASSRGNARTLLGQGSVYANGRRIAPDHGVDPAMVLHGRWLLLRKGRSTYHVLDVSGE
jgi:tyrosyl-tRNA synthetase